LTSFCPDGQIACHFLHFAKTEDIWLKSSIGRKGGFLLRKEEARN
jgi:hypothetical protein